MQSHSHSTQFDESNSKALKVTGWMTGIYFLIELFLGIYSGSVAVTSDAFHTFSAVGGVILAIIAANIALRPADKFKSFGRLRAEIIGALLNGFFLLLMAAFVVYMGIMKLKHPTPLATAPMFIAALGGIVTEIIAIKMLYSGQKNNLNMKGAFWHVIQTFVGSVIIIVAAIIIKLTGFYPIDPILGMIFGLVLFWASWSIIKGAFEILLESTPPDIDLDLVKSGMESVNGVKNVHHIHAWTLTSGKNIFSSHVLISESSDSETVLENLQLMLKSKFNFYFSTIQVEKKCDDSTADHIDITAKKTTPKKISSKHNHH